MNLIKDRIIANNKMNLIDIIKVSFNKIHININNNIMRNFIKNFMKIVKILEIINFIDNKKNFIKNVY